MDLPQVPPPRAVGPARGAIPQVARVAVDPLGQQRVDDPQRCWRAAGAWRVGETLAEIAPVAVLEAARPVVNGLPADAEEVRYVLHGKALGEPQQGLRTARFAGRGDLELRLP